MAKTASCKLAVIFAACGIPEPHAEYLFTGLSGKRKWRFDFAWPEQRIAFEREGATWTGGRHVRGKGYANDCQKYSEAAICGWVVIRATADMIRSGEALALLGSAFCKSTGSAS